MVATRPEGALADARALDARIAAGEPGGALAGLPLLVKDIEDAAGLPTTFGSLLWADAPAASKDGVAATRLRAAGAIVLGKSNTPELALHSHTANRLFGPTVNPWAPGRSPGGSSGGSAAALAAGLVPLATATDVGGSIRIPAAACGLLGLKPSAGRVGRDPGLATPDLNHLGPMAATTADARLLLGLLSGPVPGDPFSWPATTLAADRLPARIIAAERYAPIGPLPDAIDRLFGEALEVLRLDLGLPVQRLGPAEVLPSGYDGLDWLRIVITEQAHELGRDRIEREADRLDPLTLDLLREGLKVTVAQYAGARARRYRYTRELDSLLGDDAVLVMPTLTVDGWDPEGRLPDTGEAVPWWACNTELANFTGHPAASVPAGRGPAGLPFGLQIIGPHAADAMVLGLAAAFEAARPWPLVADGFTPFGPD